MDRPIEDLSLANP